VLTCNEALLEVLGGYKDKLMYNKGDYTGLADKIKFIANMGIYKRKEVGEDLRRLVALNHSVDKLIRKILKEYA
jgi:hypothetical protein